MKKIRLGDVLDVKRGASLSGEYYSDNGKYIRLTLGNFDYPGGGFKTNTAKADIYFVGPVKDEYILKKGDIITPLTEQVSGLLGETATIPEDDLYIQSGDIGLVIPNEEILDKRYAFYLVSSPIVKQQLDASAQQTKIRHTNPEAIKDCIAWIPEIDVQRKIADFLDNINEKINNNKKICNKLEEVASLIYELWFTQFDFPDKDGKPYKSSGGKMVLNDMMKMEIPEGWQCKSLLDITKRIKVGFVGTVDKYYCEANEGHPIVRPAEMSEEGIDYDSLRHITDEFYNMNKKSQVHKNDILISRCGKDGIPNIYDSNVPGQVLNAVMIEPDENEASANMIYEVLKSKYSQIQIDNSTSGSVQGVINTEMIGKIVLPYDGTVAKDFSDTIEAIFKEVFVLREDIRSLRHLKNYMTPLFMNGQAVL